MVVLLCSFCFGHIDNFDDLEFNEMSDAFHKECPQDVIYDTDVEEQY